MINPSQRFTKIYVATFVALIGVAVQKAAFAKDDSAKAELVQLREMVEKQKAQLQLQEQTLTLLQSRLGALEQEHAGAVAPSITNQAAVSTAVAKPEDAKPSDKTIPAPKLVTSSEPVQRHGLDTSWREGAPLFTSNDGSFAFHPRGRITTDFSHTDGSSFGSRNLTGTEARTIRLGMEGTVEKIFAYQLEVDFADNDPEVLSAYVTYLGHNGEDEFEVSLGNRLSERGFDASTGSQNMAFTERSVVATSIRPQKGFFGVGLTTKYFGKDWHFAGQIVGDTINNPGNADDTLTFLGRAHWNPYKSEAGTLHLAYWSFFEMISESVEAVNYNAYISGHFNDMVRVSTGLFSSPKEGFAQGAEVGFFGRSMYAYGEYGVRNLSSRIAGVSDIEHRGWAVTSGWFLTGERPPYASRNGTFGRMNVKRPVGTGGFGAIELRARYESLDYTDFALGGDGTAWTAGVTWHLNRSAKAMFDYIFWETDNRAGDYQGADDGQTVVARLQFTW